MSTLKTTDRISGRSIHLWLQAFRCIKKVQSMMSNLTEVLHEYAEVAA